MWSQRQGGGEESGSAGRADRAAFGGGATTRRDASRLAAEADAEWGGSSLRAGGGGGGAAPRLAGGSAHSVHSVGGHSLGVKRSWDPDSMAAGTAADGSDRWGQGAASALGGAALGAGSQQGGAASSWANEHLKGGAAAKGRGWGVAAAGAAGGSGGAGSQLAAAAGAGAWGARGVAGEAAEAGGAGLMRGHAAGEAASWKSAAAKTGTALSLTAGAAGDAWGQQQEQQQPHFEGQALAGPLALSGGAGVKGAGVALGTGSELASIALQASASKRRGLALCPPSCAQPMGAMRMDALHDHLYATRSSCATQQPLTRTSPRLPSPAGRHHWRRSWCGGQAAA